MKIDLLSLLEKLKTSWTSSYGIIISIIVYCFLYFSYLWDKLSVLFHGNGILNFTVFCCLLIILFLSWLFTSKRFFFRLQSELVIAIHVSIDHVVKNDDDVTSRIKRILDDLIRDIHNQFNQKKIKIILLPFNQLSGDSMLKNFIEKRRYSIDSLFDIQLNSGKFDQVEKMVINKLNVLAFLDHEDSEKQIFFEKIKLQQELNLVNYHKNWDYIYSNDGNDKIKIGENLKESIIHYCGIYCIYLGKHELSLELLNSIFKPQDRQIENIKKDQNGKMILSTAQIVSSRLATILFNLYLALAFDKLTKNEQQQAFEIFSKCEQLGNNQYSYAMFIGMSRVCFELDKIPEAIKYNNKAKILLPTGRETTINDAWFAAIKNDVPRFCMLYSRLIMKGLVKSQNYVEMLDFISRYRDKYPESKFLFDFMYGYISFESEINKEIGHEILETLRSEITEQPIYIQLLKLTDQILSPSKSKRSTKNRK